jgi:hypothetical protein
MLEATWGALNLSSFSSPLSEQFPANQFFKLPDAYPEP